MKILLVGESNPYSVRSGLALWPAPINSAGWRLCHRILEMKPYRYLRTFDRVNLCNGEWDLDEARERAWQLRRENTQPLVLLGAKVCQAFDFSYVPFTVQTSILGPEKEIMILPHPSGRSFAWNHPESVTKARQLITEMLDRIKKL